MKITSMMLAGRIDSTLLKPEASRAELSSLCENAVKWSIGAVCVYPEHMAFVMEQIFNTSIRLDAVAGFPEGTEPTKEKCLQTEDRIKQGADEVDMVMNLDWFLDKRFAKVRSDIEEVVNATNNVELKRNILDKPVIKVIIETSLLEAEAKRLDLAEGSLIRDASKIVVDAGADFVKTSTGMRKEGGVKEGHVSFIKKVIPQSVGIKAAGGIRSWEQVQNLIEEGADRFGTSSAKNILEELDAKLQLDFKN